MTHVCRRPARRRFLANPADLRLVTRDGGRGSLGISNDDWRNRHPGGRKAERIFSIGRIEKTLRKTDPTAAEPGGVCGEHEIFGRQRTILDDPGTLRAGRDQNQYRRVIEDVKVRVRKMGPEMIGCLLYTSPSPRDGL